MTVASDPPRLSVGEELEAIGFVPIPSKLYPPSPGIVSRAPLVARVRARRGEVVAVTAPAGYGKSTFIAELVAADPRPIAWLSLSSTENDPAALLTYIALALDRIEPVEATRVTALWTRTPKLGTTVLAQFISLLAGRQPFVLVLDDVHELTDRDVLDLLPVLIAELPAGSTFVVGSRTAMPLPVGRMRVKRRLVEVGPADLAFDAVETAALLRSLGHEAPAIGTARLVERTEGWPVAIYLAALAQDARGGDLADVLADFAGDHRFLADFLGDELLAGLDPSLASFLMEASCFERASGPLCDGVLERTDSSVLLAGLQRRNLLVIPLDDRREWYRFHHLLSEFLRSELRRRDPDRFATIHRRASDWYQAHGEADGAVMHAVLGGDLDRAEALVMHWFGRFTTSGHYPSVERWLGMLPADALDTHPGLMVVAAHGRFRDSEPAAAAQWLDRAAEALPERHPDDVHGLVVPVQLALSRAIISPLGPLEMIAESRYAYDHVGLGEGHPLSCLCMGAAAFMLGDDAQAERWLREAAETTLDRPTVVGSALAHLAVVEVERDRWEAAADLAQRAKVIVGRSIQLPPSNLVLAVNVLVETYDGGGKAAEADWQGCRGLLTGLLHVAPWLNLQSRVALARAALIRGNRAEAAALVDEAETILRSVPDAVGVARQLASLRRGVSTRPAQDHGPAALTTAELRVLQLLPTHLSIAAMADRLYVSRNTVKSQTIAIYRKLGTSSRSGAVEAAVELGLLDIAARHG
jgi:LuxR family transcriptional regulator, maltose regulon positive regulatory protein